MNRYSKNPSTQYARQDLNREALLRNNKACELLLNQDPQNESLFEKPSTQYARQDLNLKPTA